MAKYEPKVEQAIHEIAMECAMSKFKGYNIGAEKATREKQAKAAFETYQEIFNLLAKESQS